MKRAAVYIRVSTEKQSERISPETQESDCRALAERQRYTVVAVYRDTERYRVGKRLVEPSGTRADRPGLRAMLADARAGKFGVILAWREDRLYRSQRAMLDVLEMLEEMKGNVTIELAKEHFDADIAPIKAWAAKMELRARHERQMMGIGGRLAQGKALSQQNPYGYGIDENGRYIINSDEAEVVRFIWRSYGAGVALAEIRRRLIEMGAAQRNGENSQPWRRSHLYRQLGRDYYATGLFQVRSDGRIYEIPIPPIIDPATAAAVQKRRAEYKVYPAGNLRVLSLFAGKVFCRACGVRMQVHTTKAGGRLYPHYRCNNHSLSIPLPGCAGTVKVGKVDTEGWNKVWALFANSGEIEASIQRKIEQLRKQEVDAKGEREKLENRLSDLALERQKIITWGRKQFITEGDMRGQLAVLDAEEKEIQHDLADMALLVGDRVERLQAIERYCYRTAEKGLRILLNPQTPEGAAAAWEFKKKLVAAIVERVEIASDKTISVTVDLDLARQPEPQHINTLPVYWQVNDILRFRVTV